jgi:AAA family ATP:ADP antiporter
MPQTESATFSGIRSYLWPIHAHEIKKLVPMVIMLALVALNYSILRNLKDALLITAHGSGAEVIPFVKLWGMLPAAIIATMLFSYLLNRFSRAAVFQIIILSFSAFFLFFCLFIYPNREALHPNDSADFLETILPLGCKGLVAMYRNWTLTGFYIISELWGTIVLQVLIWGFANEVTKISEAPRFYSVMVIASNIAAICAGQIAVSLSGAAFDSNFGFGKDAWEQSMTKMLLLIVGLALITLLTFRWMNRYVLSDPSCLPKDNERSQKKGGSKKKLTFKESLVCIANSKYLLGIASIVISYNLVINLVEVIWKDRLRQLYPLTVDYNIYVNNLTSAMGIISTIASMVMAGIIYRLGWTKTALLTPAVLMITTIAFFGCLFGGESLAPIVSTLLGTTPLALAVFFGSVQNCFTKAAKYSVFDATKEMAFIPLDREERMKGKAAIDGIGSRMAKSGGSVIHQGLLLFFGTLTYSAPYVALIVIGVTAVWIMAVKSLGRKFRQYTKEHEETPVAETVG